VRRARWNRARWIKIKGYEPIILKVNPNYAAALVIQAGTNKLAIVGLDLGRSPAERSLQIIRQRIKAEAGIDYSFRLLPGTDPELRR
jgi:hypothetical protein